MCCLSFALYICWSFNSLFWSFSVLTILFYKSVWFFGIFNNYFVIRCYSLNKFIHLKYRVQYNTSIKLYFRMTNTTLNDKITLNDTLHSEWQTTHWMTKTHWVTHNTQNDTLHSKWHTTHWMTLRIINNRENNKQYTEWHTRNRMTNNTLNDKNTLNNTLHSEW